MNENQEDEEEGGDSPSTPFPSSPLFGRLRGTFNPENPREREASSHVAEPALLGLIMVLIIALTTTSLFISISGDYTNNRVPQRAKEKPNLLGLYRMTMRLPGECLEEVNPKPVELPVYPKREEEAYFLRYYVMPLEPVQGGAGNSSSSDDATTIVTTTRLMNPRSRLLKTARALKQELEITAKEDILQPLVERWSGRIEVAKRRLERLPARKEREPQEDPSQEFAATTTLLISDASGGVSLPKSFLGGIYPSDLLVKNADLLPAFPKLPLQAAIHKARKTPPSVCPSSLFCYYTISPTNKQASGSSECPTFCRRCFETTSELRHAIQSYLRDPSHTSQVARTYGWPIGNWCVSYLTDFSFLFAGTDFNENIINWDLSSATTIRSMFQNATQFNQRLQSWDTSKVQDFGFLLAGAAGASNFNQPLNHWDTSRVTSLHATFAGASRFNQDLNQWHVAKVHDMSRTFSGATKFAGDISTWTTTSAKSMYGIFRDAVSFEGDLSTWSFRGVTDMSYAFAQAVSFQPDSVNDWDVSRVQSMKSLFMGVSSFNANVSSWNTALVTDFSHLFDGCSKFNQDLLNWNVGQATDMQFMFAGASSFNGQLTDWDVSRVRNMTGMFLGASSLEQDLTSWKPRSVGENRESMFEGAMQFERRYKDAIYAAWARHASQNSMMFGEGHGDVLEKEKTLLHLWTAVRNITKNTAATKTLED